VLRIFGDKTVFVIKWRCSIKRAARGVRSPPTPLRLGPLPRRASPAKPACPEPRTAGSPFAALRLNGLAVWA